jgi:hypothetical protein
MTSSDSLRLRLQSVRHQQVRNTAALLNVDHQRSRKASQKSHPSTWVSGSFNADSHESGSVDLPNSELYQSGQCKSRGGSDISLRGCDLRPFPRSTTPPCMMQHHRMPCTAVCLLNTLLSSQKQSVQHGGTTKAATTYIAYVGFLHITDCRSIVTLKDTGE